MNDSSESRCERMRHEIILCAKANGQSLSGDFWFMLVFRTESELVAICQELNIKLACETASTTEIRS